jgi:hypothetical protein
MDYVWKYEPKNRSERRSSSYPNTLILCGPVPEDSEVSNRVYEASRRLNKFCYRVEFVINTPTVSNFYRTRTMGVTRDYSDCPGDI